MGVMIKNLKELKSGKYQYRRAWPKDVREAIPGLSRELKKTFSETLSRHQAIKEAERLDKFFQDTLNEVRSGVRKNMQELELHEHVSRWFRNNRQILNEPIYTEEYITPDGERIEIQETAKDHELEKLLEEAGRQFGRDEQGDPKDFTPQQRLKLDTLREGKVPELELTISRAVQIYVERHCDGVEKRSTKVAKEQAIEFFGDVPLSEIDRALANNWAFELAKQKSQSHSTIMKRTGALKAVVNYVKDHGLYSGDNPFTRLKPPKIAKKSKDRLPFHEVHLEALRRYIDNSNLKQETKDILELLLYTGCRPSEIAGLRAVDVQIDQEIPYIYIREFEGRRLKNTHSRRRIPLVGNALDAARNCLERSPQGWLFPTLAPSTFNTNDSDKLSARLRKVIRKAGIAQSGRLVPYSFRHTMAAALNMTEGLDLITRERLMGHEKIDRYGAADPTLEKSLEALEKAIPLLGKVDSVEYTEEELSVGSG